MVVHWDYQGKRETTVGSVTMEHSSFCQFDDMEAANKLMIRYMEANAPQQALQNGTAVRIASGLEGVNLFGYVKELARAFVRLADDRIYTMRCNMQGVITQPGVRSIIHDHAGHNWVVVYYPADAEGDLVVAHTDTYKPKEGLMVMFAGTEPHQILENQGSTNRYSVAINFRI